METSARIYSHIPYVIEETFTAERSGSNEAKNDSFCECSACSDDTDTMSGELEQARATFSREQQQLQLSCEEVGVVTSRDA